MGSAPLHTIFPAGGFLTRGLESSCHPLYCPLQFKAQLEKIDKSLRALPATAQVLSSQCGAHARDLGRCPRGSQLTISFAGRESAR